MDIILLDAAGPQDPAAPLHSETPGLILDRLSILALKIFHTEEETHRESTTEAHRERNRGRLALLQEQRSDLAGCLDVLWDEVLHQRRRFKLYRQMKMYNDPELNPAISASGQSGSMDVNALHVVANNPAGGPPLADVIVSHAHADITCPASPSPPPPCSATSTDFVTGGGWVVSRSDPNAKANFAVAGGKDGSWGHLMFIDHGNGLRAKGTAVNGYGPYPPFGANGRQTRGSADVGGTSESYEADVADNGEPGTGTNKPGSEPDKFQLLLNGAVVASDDLAGGNIQLHKPQCQ